MTNQTESVPLSDAEIAEALRGFALADEEGHTPAVMAFALWCNRNLIAPRAVEEVVALRAARARLRAALHLAKDEMEEHAALYSDQHDGPAGCSGSSLCRQVDAIRALLRDAEEDTP